MRDKMAIRTMLDIEYDDRCLRPVQYRGYMGGGDRIVPLGYIELT
jgi:hypothetical protein